MHGALLDAEILADVFLLMTGGQSSLLDETQSNTEQPTINTNAKHALVDRPALKIISCTDEELSIHQLRLEAIEKTNGACIWNQ